jgi:hypothetical protein
MISRYGTMACLLSLSCFLIFSTAQASSEGAGPGQGASGQYSLGQAPQTVEVPSTPTTGQSAIDVENTGTGQVPQGMNSTTTGVISPEKGTAPTRTPVPSDGDN